MSPTTAVPSPVITQAAETAAASPIVSIVMPCLNEATTLGRCIDRAREGLDRLGRPGEIVVADNGSTDGSIEIAKAHGARVVHVRQRGYGAAYRGGFAAARGALVVMGDSDDTYDFSRIDEFVRVLEDGADLVVGSRLRGDIAPGAMPWLHRYVGNPLLSATLNLFYGTRISDTHSGMRAFRREAYDGLGLRTTGMEFASEMLIAAARARWTIREIPIAYHPREGESKLRTFRDGWRHLRLLLLYSPTHLFTFPGLAMLGLGIALLAALVGGPITIAGRLFDFHFMFLGSLLASLGMQVLLLGVFAKSEEEAPRWFTLERGLSAGAVSLAAGFLINLGILVRWIAMDFGPLNAIRLGIVALTLMVVGAQLLFSSFYLDLLRSARADAALPPASDVDASPRSR